MIDPRKRRYIYLMLSLFGAISLSVVLFFLIYRIRGIGDTIKNLSDILAPFIYGGVVAYLLRPLCNLYERFLVDWGIPFGGGGCCFFVESGALPDQASSSMDQAHGG